MNMRAISGDFIDDANFLIDIECSDSLIEGKAITYSIQHYGGYIKNNAFPSRNDAGGWFIVIPLQATEAPIMSIKIEATLKLEVNLRNFLESIFPETNADFDRMFRRKVQRYGGLFTNYFTARQIARHFDGAFAYRCVSAVVMAYKAVELRRRDLCIEALAEIETCLIGVGACDITTSPRTNREHLIGSMLCAKWHIELTLQDWVSFMDTLETAQAYSTGFSNYFTPAYPISSSMVVLGAIKSMKGDVNRVKALTEDGIKMFQKAVSDARRNPTHFKELEVSHRNITGLIQLEALNVSKSDKHMKKILSKAVRVPDALRSKLISDIIFYGRSNTF